MRTISVETWNNGELEFQTKNYACPANVKNADMFGEKVQLVHLYNTYNRLNDKYDSACVGYGKAVEADDAEKITKAEKTMKEAKKALDSFNKACTDEGYRIPTANTFDYEVNAYVACFFGAYNLEVSDTGKAYIGAVKNYRKIYIDDSVWSDERKERVKTLKGYLDSYITATFPGEEDNYKAFDFTLKARHFDSFASKVYGATKKGTGKMTFSGASMTIVGTQTQDKKPESAIIDLFLEVFDKLGCKAPEKAQKKGGFTA